MIKVLFVCLGNICRSPIGEAVFRHIVKNNGLSDVVFVDSCGTASYHISEDPHPCTKEVLEKHGVCYNNIKASTFSVSYLDEYDYIIAMDEQNLSNILKYEHGGAKARISLLSQFSKDDWTSVPDPWFTGNFDLAYNLIKEGCEGLFAQILCEIKQEDK